VDTPTGTGTLTTTVIVFSLVAGMSMLVENCKRSGYEETVKTHKAAEQERLENVRFHEVAYGDRQGPETPYFTALRHYMANAAEASASATPSDPILFAETIRTGGKITIDHLSDVRQTMLPGNTELIEQLAKNPQQEAIYKRWNKTLDNVFLRKWSVPKSLRTPIEPPKPPALWSAWLIATMYMMASGLTVVSLLITHSVDPDDITRFFRTYPWKTAGGAISMLLAAPATILIGARYVLPRALQYDWKEGSKRFAYHARILRKLPPPQTEPLPLEGPGPLAMAPATAALQTAQEAPTEPPRRTRPVEAQWFGIDADLAQGRHAAIAAAGLRPVQLDITMPFEGKIVAVPLSDMDRFEQAAGLSADTVQYEETDIRSLYMCTFAGQAGTVHVSCEQQHQERVRNMLLRLSARHGGMDIVFDASSMVVPNPRPLCGGITVLHCTSLAEDRTTTITERAFGRDLGNERTLIVPAPGRGRLITDKEGIVVAQLVGRVLYTYLHGILSAKAAWADEALIGMIEQAIVHMGEDEAASTEQGKTWRDTLDERRKEYVRLSLTRFVTEIAETEKAFTECGARIEEERVTLTKSIREQRRLQDTLARLKDPAKREERERGLVAEFDRLAASEFVEGVACDDGHVDVFTVPARIAHEEKTHEIGRFRIRMHEGGRIHIENIASTSKTTDWHHPHIRPDGYVCFGNVSESVAKYLADRQFAIVAGLVWRFLQQYNPHQGVQDITHWKEV